MRLSIAWSTVPKQKFSSTGSKKSIMKPETKYSNKVISHRDPVAQPSALELLWVRVRVQGPL